MKNHVIGLVTGLFVFGMVGIANATIMANGLEWLEFSYTAGMTRLDVENEFGQNIFSGYRYATRAETAALLDSYYSGDITLYDDGFRIGSASAADAFLDDFGPLASFGLGQTVNNYDVNDGAISYNQADYNYFFYGGEGELPNFGNSTFFGHVALYSLDTSPVAGWFDDQDGTDDNSVNVRTRDKSYSDQFSASLLVRDVSQPVPEPATMLLFGTGLLGLVGIRRRKKA